jgi:hypothetical protein
MNAKDQAKKDYEANIQLMQDLMGRLDAVEKKTTSEVEHPDPTKHKYISFVKSFFRIIAGIALCFGEFAVAGVLLIVAEALGIYEEMV